jgi:hypothetical protein
MGPPNSDQFMPDDLATLATLLDTAIRLIDRAPAGDRKPMRAVRGRESSSPPAASARIGRTLLRAASQIAQAAGEPGPRRAWEAAAQGAVDTMSPEQRRAIAQACRELVALAERGPV